MNICNQCHKPQFSGAYGYVGDVCKCFPNSPLTQPVELETRVRQLESQVEYLMRRIDFMGSRK